MKISVIMLTYNREELVGRAIESVLKQTFRDFELIVVDNGSTDGSGAVADSFAVEDDRVCVIHRKSGTIAEGRNAGLDLAMGEYITFVDDDDRTEPDFLEFLYGLATVNAADVAICGTSAAAFDEKYVMNPVDALKLLMGRSYYNVGFPTKLFKREIFDGVRFPPNKKFDDIALMYKLLASAEVVAYHGLPKYNVFRHDNNHSAWTTNHSLLTAEILGEYLQVYDERTRYLCGKFPENASDWEYFEWSFMVSMTEKVSRLELADCYRLRDRMVQRLKNSGDKFLAHELTQDFERDWFDKYITKGDLQ